MAEIEEAAHSITQKAAPDANIIFGATIDKELKGKIKISVIATGFDNTKANFLKNIKKSTIIESDPTPKTAPQPENSNEPKEISDQEVKKLLGNQDVPEGIDIVDEFDIPAFLRKKN
jgi:cell division protein FtsZ